MNPSAAGSRERNLEADGPPPLPPFLGAVYLKGTLPASASRSLGSILSCKSFLLMYIHRSATNHAPPCVASNLVGRGHVFCGILTWSPPAGSGNGIGPAFTVEWASWLYFVHRVAVTLYKYTVPSPVVLWERVPCVS